jgi:aldehyde dehydrogenase (NAD+)
MATTTSTNFKNFIGGEWVDAASGETFESTSPATGETIGVFPRSGAEDVDRAVAVAKEAFAEWRLRSAARSSSASRACSSRRSPRSPT